MTPPSTHADLLTERSKQVLEPLIKLLIAHGVTYPRLSTAIKQVYVSVARAELTKLALKETDTAISMLSGLHRTDIRQLTQASKVNPTTTKQQLSSAEQVMLHWRTDSRYLDSNGQPRRLALRQTKVDEPSFESLIEQVCQSGTQTAAVINELLRLKQIRVEGQMIRLRRSGAVPSAQFKEAAEQFAQKIRTCILTESETLQVAPPATLQIMAKAAHHPISKDQPTP